MDCIDGAGIVKECQPEMEHCLIIAQYSLNSKTCFEHLPLKCLCFIDVDVGSKVKTAENLSFQLGLSGMQ